MSRFFVGRLAPVVWLVACTANGEDEVYSPSLTQVRTGKVAVSDAPPIPFDEYIPGIVVAPEQWDYATEGELVEYVLDTSHFEELDDPAILDKHKEFDYPYDTGSGSLVDENAEVGIEYDDVRQGSIGDCYLAAALASAIYIDVDDNIREGLVREVQDADSNATKFVVRFYDYAGKPQDVSVDADIVRRDGKSLYMRSSDSATGQEEWWTTIVEKAYAKWHGSYEEIGNGGWAGDVLQALTGSTATSRTIAYMDAESIFDAIDSNIDDNKPVVAGTFGKEDGVNYDGTGVYAWHAYSVLGVRKDGEQIYVKLRNPWGYDEPAGNGDNDGIFEMKVEDFTRLYKTLTLGGGTVADHTAPGTVSNLALGEIGDGKVVVTFTAPGDDGSKGLAFEYDVRVSTAAITSSSFYSATRVTVADPASPGAAERLTLTGLTNGTPVYVAVRALDEAGNAGSVSNVVSGTPVGATEPEDPSSSFTFESGVDGFSATGLWHRTDLDAAVGDHSFWFGDDSTVNYDTGDRTSGELTSPAFSVPSNALLTWKQLLDVEAETAYDQATVQVATASGGYADWATVWTKGSVSGSFTSEQASLFTYAGQTVKVRFVFDSMDSYSNATLGWFVDEVVVAAQ